MPNTNDFKPFATGVGANVIDQATYVALAALAAGFANGIADPAQLNKVWRQASFVSSAIAQLMSDSLHSDILDDGNIAEFETNLAAALRGALGTATDTGAANAYIIAPAPAPTAYAIGQTFTVLAAHDCTGASTINVAGLGAKNIVKADGTALLGGEILAGQFFKVSYTGTAFQLVASNVRPGFSKMQTYSAAGTYAFVVPAGVYLLDVEGWGGGGGGAGNPVNVVGQCGGGGAYGRKLIAVTPGQSITVTIPAAAAGGVAGANNGQNGGTCSFGAFMSIPGGGGGPTSTGTNASGGTAPTGVDVAMAGQPSASIGPISSQAYGQGGAAPRGGAGGFTLNGGGGSGNWPGGGGGAGYNSISAINGGAGAVGGFIVRW